AWATPRSREGHRILSGRLLSFITLFGGNAPPVPNYTPGIRVKQAAAPAYTCRHVTCTTRHHRLAARRGHRLDDRVPFLLRFELLRMAEAELVYRSVLDLAAHGHREPVPVLRGPGPGDRRRPGPGLAPVLETLEAGCRLRAAGHRRLVPDVPQELHLLRRAARHRVDAHRRAADGRLAPLAVAGRSTGHCHEAARVLRAPAVARTGFPEPRRLELAGTDRAQARHRRLCAAVSVARRDVVGH